MISTPPPAKSWKRPLKNRISVRHLEATGRKVSRRVAESQSRGGAEKAITGSAFLPIGTKAESNRSPHSLVLVALSGFPPVSSTTVPTMMSSVCGASREGLSYDTIERSTS